MDDFTPPLAGIDMVNQVTLVDRAMEGGPACEFLCDGVRFTWPKGQVEKVVPRGVVEWLFTVSQKRVWTTDGEYVMRFGIKDCPPDLQARLGSEATNCDPIEIDPNAVEGWDRDGVTGNRRVVYLDSRDVRAAKREMRERLAASAGAGFGKGA